MLDIKPKDARMNVDPKFSQILWENYDQFSKAIEDKTGKKITFLEYTAMLANLKTLTTPIFIQIQPIKKGKFSKQVTIDLRNIL